MSDLMLYCASTASGSDRSSVKNSTRNENAEPKASRSVAAQAHDSPEGLRPRIILRGNITLSRLHAHLQTREPLRDPGTSPGNVLLAILPPPRVVMQGDILQSRMKRHLAPTDIIKEPNASLEDPLSVVNDSNEAKHFYDTLVSELETLTTAPRSS